jgi:hypothetical protein
VRARINQFWGRRNAAKIKRSASSQNLSQLKSSALTSANPSTQSNSGISELTRKP